ncbi:hypothetical protein GJ496_003100 [Pomphorhynchus laevis]|nr:hypothetical protein GJ496_003100 [Pomphorhynchus laevis]
MMRICKSNIPYKNNIGGSDLSEIMLRREFFSKLMEHQMDKISISKVKLGNEVIDIYNELLKLIVSDLIERSVHAASNRSKSIDNKLARDLENILPGVLNEF